MGGGSTGNPLTFVVFNPTDGSVSSSQGASTNVVSDAIIMYEQSLVYESTGSSNPKYIIAGMTKANSFWLMKLELDNSDRTTYFSKIMKTAAKDSRTYGVISDGLSSPTGFYVSG